MDQIATLTTGWEPNTRLDDSVPRQFVFAYADRVAWMAQATHGRANRDAAASPTPARHRAAITAAASPGRTRPSVLLASDDGRNGYRQLGFLDLVRLTIWEYRPANLENQKGGKLDDRTRHHTRVDHDRS